MNSVANGKIYKNTKFKKIYIPAAAMQEGLSEQHMKLLKIKI